MSVTEIAERISLAIRNSGQEKAIERLLGSVGDLPQDIETIVQWRDETGMFNLCQLAILYGRTAEVKMMVSMLNRFLFDQNLYLMSRPLSCSGQSMDTRSLPVNMPLHLACWLGQGDIAGYLLDKGLDDRKVGSVTPELLSKSTCNREKVPKTFQTQSMEKENTTKEEIRLRDAIVLGEKPGISVNKYNCPSSLDEDQLTYTVDGTPLQLAILANHTLIVRQILDFRLDRIMKECKKSQVKNQHFYVFFTKLYEHCRTPDVSLLHKAFLCCDISEIPLVINCPDDVPMNCFTVVQMAIICGNVDRVVLF